MESETEKKAACALRAAVPVCEAFQRSQTHTNKLEIKEIIIQLMTKLYSMKENHVSLKAYEKEIEKK